MNIARALEIASEHHSSGDLQEAETICYDILAYDQENAEALQMLGILRFKQSDHESAVSLAKKAIAIKPDNFLFHYNLAEIYRSLFRLADAALCYEKAIQLNSGFAQARSNYGIVLFELGLTSSAIESYRQSLLLAPNSKETLINLGKALCESGLHHDSIDCYKRVIELDDGYIEAYECLYDVCTAAGNLSREMAGYRHAIRESRCPATVLRNLSRTLIGRESFKEALEAYKSLIDLNPDAEDYIGMGIVERKMGRNEEAHTCFSRAVEIDPGFWKGHCYLGSLCYEQGMFGAAKEHYRTAAHLGINDGSAHINLGTLLAEEGFIDEAMSCYAQAYDSSLGETAKIRTALTMPVIHESDEEIRNLRARLIRNIERLRKESMIIRNPIEQLGKAHFYLAYHGLNDREIQTELADFYESICPDLNFIAPHCNQEHVRTNRMKIRIGFVSVHLRKHTVGHYTRGIIENLNHELFEVYTFTFPCEEDEISTSIRQHSDRFIQLSASLDSARHLISQAELDILFYPDIGMEPFTYFLAFSRLAPVQCVFYGHPDTTGIRTIDYYISHEECEPDDADEHYTEKLVALPRNVTYACFHKPALGTCKNKRHNLGIDDSAHLYLCTQSLFKVHPEFDDIVKNILCRDDKAVIVFFEGMHANWTDLLRKRFHTTLEGHADRVRFHERQPFDQYLELVDLADVILDTIHFSGGATAFDAFAVGTPIVTLPGRFMRGRQTYSLYKRMGITDCIAYTPEEYVNIALHIVADPFYRENLKNRILSGNAAIFEDVRMVRELEKKLVAMTGERRPADNRLNRNVPIAATPLGVVTKASISIND